MHASKSVPVKSQKKKTRVSNLAKIDVVNPIPFENGQAFSYINNSSYLPFLHPKNDFAQNLLEARLLSVTHNACITTKRDYFAGDGFMDAKGRELTKEQLEWLANMNLRNQHVTDVNAQIFEEELTYGNAPIEVVRFTVAGKKKLFIYPHSFLEWRLGNPNDDDIVQNAIQSKLFLKKEAYINADAIKRSKNLPIYSPNKIDKQNWFRDAKGVERTLIWFKNPVTGFNHYGLPSSIAAMIYQLLEYKSARYNMDTFDNNMVVASILALKGQLSDVEANKIAQQIIKQHTGDGKRGRTVVVASEEGIDGSDFHKIDTKTDGSFTEADDKWAQKIILANQWDAILAGIISPSTLGKGANFITKILEQKFNSVIKPAQRNLMNKVWKHIFKIADEWLGLGLQNLELEIRNTIDISGLTDVDITPAVQVNEVRRAKGLPEDPNKEGEYMKSTGPQIQPKDKKDEEDPDDV